MKSFAIYTVLIGEYDKIEQPLQTDDRFDYILFSDSVKEPFVGIWQVRTVPYENNDLQRKSRFPKMFPHILLPEYKAWLYIDANVRIISSGIYSVFLDKYERNVDWAGIIHPQRKCIYEEAYQVISQSLENESLVIQICCYLRKHKFPRNIGLFENNVIFRRNSQVIADINNDWWKIYDQFVRRDQLSLSYILWCHNTVKVESLLPPGVSTRGTSDTVRAVDHCGKNPGFVVKESLWSHWKSRCRNGIPSFDTCFKNIHFLLYRFPPKIAVIGINIWGGITVLTLGAAIKYNAVINRKHR